MKLDAWDITKKNGNRFVARYGGIPVAAVTIYDGGKSWDFKSLDPLGDRQVYGFDRYTILGFVLPMFGVKAPVRSGIEEGQEYTDKKGDVMFVEQVDPKYVVVSYPRLGNFRISMDMFLSRFLTGEYKFVTE